MIRLYVYGMYLFFFSGFSAKRAMRAGREATSRYFVRKDTDPDSFYKYCLRVQAVNTNNRGNVVLEIARPLEAIMDTNSIEH